ncbi:hypothetical protein HUU05_16730 [candidate division KSB1 bacterium]|nr:hypothetical protein [candidate division KSB1 bacterium]
MTREQALTWLHDLTRRWRMRMQVSIALKSLSVAFVAGVVAQNLFAGCFAYIIVVGFSAFVLCELILQRRSRLDAHLVARHLNRTVPALEESCEILLKPASSHLSLLEELQQERLLRALAQSQHEVRLPSAPLASAFKFATACILSALVLHVTWGALRRHAPHAISAFMPLSPSGQTQLTVPSPPKLKTFEIAITPPAYTNKPRRLVSDFNLAVEENALVAWRLTFEQALTRGVMIWNAQDTLALHSAGGTKYVAQLQARENSFYQFLFENNAELQSSSYFRVEVINDNAPALRVTSLAARTVIMPGQLPHLSLQAEAEDDYGLVTVAAFATLARGTGEAVRFREATLDFEKIEKKSTRHWQLQHALDLAQLGMAPGDELYFFLEARDNREPAANRSRSETFFVIWQDTASAMLVESSGLIINPLPEYFRSQRQIIIDTEKLIRDRPHLSVAELQKRSQNLGFDQQALRMRYGEYLGEEIEEGGAQEIAHAGEKIDKSAADTKESAVDKIVEEFEHQHDIAENATLFAPSVKTQLKAALAEMWEAELHLRLYHPEAALPYEYRALALLKSVQQHSRVYVQRVGFEATPIKVAEKRLTGDLEKIATQTSQKVTARDSSFRDVRAALLLLRRAEQTQPAFSQDEIATIERASRELARAALKQSHASLRALQDLHELLADFKNHRKPCASCLLSAQRALWQLLPQPSPAPAQGVEANSVLAQRYFEKLSAPF